MSVATTQAFLNEPTLEAARERYLESWSNPAVRKSWKDRKPTLRQFEARFGDAHAIRQESLKLQMLEGGERVLDDKRLDDIQGLAEAVEAGVQAAIAALKPPRFAEASADDEAEAEAASELEVRTDAKSVKPANVGKLPTSKQLYFYLHRAVEAGHQFVTIPVTRGMAAEGRALMAEGSTYVQAITALSKKSRAA